MTMSRKLFLTACVTFIVAGKFICFDIKSSDQTFKVDLEVNQEFRKEGNLIVQY